MGVFSLVWCKMKHVIFSYWKPSFQKKWHCSSVWSIAWKWNFWMFCLKNSKIQHFVFLCLSGKVICKYWSSVAKTVPRLQMDSENMKWIWSGKGAASALFGIIACCWVGLCTHCACSLRLAQAWETASWGKECESTQHCCNPKIPCEITPQMRLF